MCAILVVGLIGAGDRKGVQPLAPRDGEVGYDQLHHFVASGVWDIAPLGKVQLAQTDRMVGGAAGGSIIDDAALPIFYADLRGVTRRRSDEIRGRATRR